MVLTEIYRVEIMVDKDNLQQVMDDALSDYREQIDKGELQFHTQKHPEDGKVYLTLSKQE